MSSPSDTAAAPRAAPSLPASGAPTLSVVIPCFNERPNVVPMIARLDAALAGIAWEAIYVDDDSPDGTAGKSAGSPRPTRGCAAFAGSAVAAWPRR